eukprot:CAMPEP_0184491914 /NCGR_PEP_ID=MMETSP0113_2-20130426/21721_1 /TAXON_ID=91329 /ORGANISM="Norrisiella sphaerica, Strain BC52" /LENGTH=365 /DNA_ID=CAMNT_0026876473 /DNA_START=92 /DNA_END=1189 /DNA_ORIENTATION=-
MSAEDTTEILEGTEEYMAAVNDLKSQIAKLEAEVEQLRNKESKESILGSMAIQKGLSSPFTTLKERRTLTGHYGRIYGMQWSRTGKNIVSAAQDGKLIVWNAFYSHLLYVIKLHSTWVMTCGYSPDNEHVASGGLDNNCTIWRLGDKKYHQAAVLRRHDGYLSAVEYKSKDEVITSSGDKSCILWNLGDSSPKVKRGFYGHKGDISAISVDPQDENLLVSGGGTSKLWDVRQKEAVMTFRDAEADVAAVDFMAGAKAFVSGDEKGSCRLYDLRSYRTVARYDVKGSVTCVEFSRTGRFFFAGYDDPNCRVWSTLDTGEVKDSSCQTLQGHMNRVSCLGVEPEEGKALATGDWGVDWYSKICIWSP